MKAVLIGEMTRRGVTTNAIAEVIGVHRNSVHNKLYGNSDFTVTEAFKIYDAFFRGLDFRSLFE